MKCVVLTDSTSLPTLLAATLQTLGYTNCATARNGRSALQEMISCGCDLLIIDWYTDRLHGDHLVHSIRRIPEIQQVPIVAAYNTRDAPATVLAAGKIGHLSGQIDTESLKAAIAQAS